MAADDQSAAFAHRDRRPPSLFLDDCSKELDLVGAVPVWVDRVRFEFPGINELVMGAVDGHSLDNAVNRLTAPCVSRVGLRP